MINVGSIRNQALHVSDYVRDIVALMYNYFNNNLILATICTLCEAPESNTVDSGAIQINCIIIIIIIMEIADVSTVRTILYKVS